MGVEHRTLNGTFSLMALTENCSLSILKHSKLVKSGELIILLENSQTYFHGDQGL